MTRQCFCDLFWPRLLLSLTSLDHLPIVLACCWSVLSRIWLELAISVVRHDDATASRSEVNRHRFEWLG